MSTVHIDEFHARNVSITVTDINHISERNTKVFRFIELINSRIVDIKNALFNPEKTQDPVRDAFDALAQNTIKEICKLNIR